jgi:thiol-disulfide isomerase/thioredoxin
MARSFAIAVLLLAAASAGFFGYRYWSNPSAAREPDAAVADGRRPDFALRDVDGAVQAVSKWDGKVLLVNFWATWCEPCRREIPVLNELQAAYGERGVQVIGVAIDDVEEVRSFLKALPVTYPILVGEQDAVDALAGFGAEMTVLPYTAFVRRDGKIEKLHAGEIDRDTATDLIGGLL